MVMDEVVVSPAKEVVHLVEVKVGLSVLGVGELDISKMLVTNCMEFPLRIANLVASGEEIPRTTKSLAIV